MKRLVLIAIVVVALIATVFAGKMAIAGGLSPQWQAVSLSLTVPEYITIDTLVSSLTLTTGAAPGNYTGTDDFTVSSNVTATLSVTSPVTLTKGFDTTSATCAVTPSGAGAITPAGSPVACTLTAAWTWSYTVPAGVYTGSTTVTVTKVP